MPRRHPLMLRTTGNNGKDHMGDGMETKQQIRKHHILKRNALSEEEVIRYSDKICRILREYLSSMADLTSRGVYGYYPLGKEISLLRLYPWLLENGIPLAFPKVTGEAMEFYQVDSMEDFSEGAFHIMEPVEGCKKAEFVQAVCLTPGSVFDFKGNRYGYGKGYYDRFFSMHKDVYRIGIACEGQIVSVLPAEETDVTMQALATERRIYFGITGNL